MVRQYSDRKGCVDMFGMVILNHMNMSGNNICVKLKLFNKKIEEIDKIRFSILYEENLIDSIEVGNACEYDQYSSSFVCFNDLNLNKKYKITTECYMEDEWVYCCECFTSTLTYNFQNNIAVYSEKIFAQDGLPLGGLKFEEDYDFRKFISSNISYGEVR